MNIFEATEKIKEFVPDGNNSLLKIGDELELSSGLLSMLFSLSEVKDIKEYREKTKVIGRRKGAWDLPGQTFVSVRQLEIPNFNWGKMIENTPEAVDTKEYWNFLHKEFQYCDVMSYPIFPNLANYFATKGPLYDIKIDLLPGKLNFYKNKKILEIGGGYGYLPYLLKKNGIKHSYYHADIVNRFNCDNFIDLNGYELATSISEKFDVIVMFDVFQHLGLRTTKTYFEEFKDLLNDDGHLIISTPILNKTERTMGGFFAQSYVNISENEFIQLLNDNNFSYYKTDYYCRGFLDGSFYNITKFNK
jgi:SAM-dependent methyltransferase